MGKLNVAQFSVELSLPVELLLELLQAAGCEQSTATDIISEKDKEKLLVHLRQAHGADHSAKKITLTRRETSETQSSDKSGRARTIQIEVRKRRIVGPMSIESVQAAAPGAEQIKVLGTEELSAREREAKLQAELAARQEAELLARQAFNKRRAMRLSTNNNFSEDNDVLYGHTETCNAIQIKQHVSETFVVDGTNVCWWYSQAYSKQMSIIPLISVLVEILENGDDFYCVFDAPITYNLVSQGRKNESDIINLLFEKQKDHFFRVTGSTRADGVLLHDANYNNRRIITNDIYKDYRDRYAWLSDKYTNHLIQGNFQRSGLITIDKLPYGNFQATSSLQELICRIHEIFLERDRRRDDEEENRRRDNDEEEDRRRRDDEEDRRRRDDEEDRRRDDEEERRRRDDEEERRRRDDEEERRREEEENRRRDDW